MEEEFELMAYHKWLLRISKKNRNTLAGFIYQDCANDQNQLAFELMEMTGDKEFSEESFLKAADLLIEADKR